MYTKDISLSLGMIGGASVSLGCDPENSEKKAKKELHNLSMRGGYMSSKERKRLESKAGIGGKDVEQLVAKPKTKRNDPCPCGSGKKYKKCCG